MGSGRGHSGIVCGKFVSTAENRGKYSGDDEVMEGILNRMTEMIEYSCIIINSFISVIYITGWAD